MFDRTTGTLEFDLFSYSITRHTASRRTVNFRLSVYRTLLLTDICLTLKARLGNDLDNFSRVLYFQLLSLFFAVSDTWAMKFSIFKIKLIASIRRQRGIHEA